ncbi:bifunctional DNA primase/polymerase [Microbacterium halotolerans]|uniref:bifunctional DNA primase/polymerase n=1 Tax=Microbacterium halotolerans TaxID=246613 RepID=UPI000E6ACBD1|nr:bifunctional DNA primase/polymerase [Microbacterium halotolerans]
MTDRAAWVRAVGKRPVTVTGAPASTTKRATWAPFRAVATSSVGDGYGIMLGDGIGAYDLDHVTDDEARLLLSQIPERVLFVERSMSGDGVHVFVEAPEGPGTKKWAGRHERYTRARFIRMTGDRLSLA